MTEQTRAPQNKKKAPAKSVVPKSTVQEAPAIKLKSKDNPISAFVSNVDSNIYAISGLPEEFIATLFAWVSRSPKSFKTHLEEALKDYDINKDIQSFKELDDKAKAFHEKWTVGYGHSSVSEHAVVHTGIEEISRLASAELELANQFLSITEYSQRYQKPVLGGWTNPFDKWDSASAHAEFEEFMTAMYEDFDKLIELLYTDLKKKYFTSDEGAALMNDESPEAQKKVTQKLNALMKLAFEDARYILPLSMHTQLGMTANARAWSDAISKMGNSEFKESQEVASKLREEISKVTPVLLRHAEPSQYDKNMSTRKSNMFKDVNHNPRVNMEHSTLFEVKSEDSVIDHLLALVLMEERSLDYGQASYYIRTINKDTRATMLNSLLSDMKHFDNPPEVFKQVMYQAVFHVSEANWHQLLRHNRMTEFTFAKPSIDSSYTLPRSVHANDKARHIYLTALARAEQLYRKLEEEYPTEVQYIVTNAHIRPVYASFSLWEAYHLINLRTSDEAQWDIRRTFDHLFKQLNQVHPRLFAKAKRRVK